MAASAARVSAKQLLRRLSHSSTSVGLGVAFSLLAYEYDGQLRDGQAIAGLDWAGLGGVGRCWASGEPFALVSFAWLR